jgi:AcrR family transcriptional regulator
MAHQKLLSAKDILNLAVRMVEQGGADSLSLRAVASSLGVKAPSLYRYFAHKSALEFALFEEVLRRMHHQMEPKAATTDPKARFVEMANAFVRFARENYALYAYVSQDRLRENYGSPEGKALWKTLLDTVSDLSGKPDDTASTVAVWSFLHGYATLGNSGAFGASGPKGAFEVGVSAFLNQLGSFAANANVKQGRLAVGDRNSK